MNSYLTSQHVCLCQSCSLIASPPNLDEYLLMSE